MRLTIITVNYNNCAGLQRTIDSVRMQTCSAFEWIVIDGGSTDGSLPLLEQYSSSFSYWCSEPDRGIYHAMNKGIARAKGEYCLFLNSGDYLYEAETLQRVLSYLHTADLLAADLQLIDANTLQRLQVIHTPSTYHPGILLREHFPHQSVFIRTQLLKDRPYDESIRFSADWEQMLYVLNLQQGAYAHIPFVTTCMVSDGVSDIFQREVKSEHEHIKLRYYDSFTADQFILQSLAAEDTVSGRLHMAYLAYVAFVAGTYTHPEYEALFGPYRSVLLTEGPVHWRLLSTLSLTKAMPFVRFVYTWGIRVGRRLRKECYRLYDAIYRLFRFQPSILSLEDTIDLILTRHLSLARYGDGELQAMYGEDLNFQTASSALQQKLREVATASHPQLLIGIPDVFQGLAQYSKGEQLYWRIHLYFNRPKWYSFLRKDLNYADAFMTRFYSMDRNSDLAAYRLSHLKRLWDQRDLMIVEGKDTKLGVGNDLFSNASSVHRILCPAKNAFAYLRRIEESVRRNTSPNQLIILALGPTATVLAYALCLAGYQALDLGHIDIEYEWYLMRAQDKVSVPGKFTNEAIFAVHAKQEVIGTVSDSAYDSQILDVI